MTSKILFLAHSMSLIANHNTVIPTIGKPHLNYTQPTRSLSFGPMKTLLEPAYSQWLSITVSVRVNACCISNPRQCWYHSTTDRWSLLINTIYTINSIIKSRRSKERCLPIPIPRRERFWLLKVYFTFKLKLLPLLLKIIFETHYRTGLGRFSSRAKVSTSSYYGHGGQLTSLFPPYWKSLNNDNLRITIFTPGPKPCRYWEISL